MVALWSFLNSDLKQLSLIVTGEKLLVCIHLLGKTKDNFTIKCGQKVQSSPCSYFKISCSCFRITCVLCYPVSKPDPCIFCLFMTYRIFMILNFPLKPKLINYNRSYNQFYFQLTVICQFLGKRYSLFRIPSNFFNVHP